MARSLMLLAAAGSIVLGTASGAFAADLPRPSYKAPAVYAPLAYNWTGFYAGVNAGWGWSSGDGTITMNSGSGPISGSGDGFLGGVQAGYNYQMANFVFGLEADFQGSAGKGDLNGNAGATTITGETKTPWFGTARGRLGYAMDRWLPYITGGAVYGKSTYDGTLSPGGAFSSSETFWTWTVGGGVEAALWDRWTAKVEYLYVGTPNKTPVPPGTNDLTGDVRTNILRAGMNYRF